MAMDNLYIWSLLHYYFMVQYSSPFRPITWIGTFKQRFQGILQEMDRLDAMILIGSDNEDVANPSTERRHLGFQGLQV